MVSVNEIETESKHPVIAAVEQSRQSKPAKPYISTRNMWYTDYTVPNSYIGVKEEKEDPQSKQYSIGEEIALHP